MADCKTVPVTYPRIDWDGATERHLGLIAGEAEAGLVHYREEVAAGRMALHAVKLDGWRVGTIAYVVDHDLAGPILFVTGMGAEATKGVSLAKHTAETFLPEKARELGCVAIRFWTRRAGFGRTLQDIGFKPIYVMDKALVEEN